MDLDPVAFNKALELPDHPRAGFVRLHDMDSLEAGKPRLRPVFVRYLDRLLAGLPLDDDEGEEDGDRIEEQVRMQRLASEGMATLQTEHPQQWEAVQMVFQRGLTVRAAAPQMKISHVRVWELAKAGRIYLQNYAYGRMYEED